LGTRLIKTRTKTSRISLWHNRAMQITKTLYVAERNKWRKWLEKNYKTEAEIWLVYYRKDSGKPRLPYNDAVEEALCFGWIDSTAKKIDDKSYAQRFTPRKPKSSYSQLNKERLAHLAQQGKVMPEVLEALGGLLKEKFEFPPDIIRAIKANPSAW
jgi:uncharacterized protein YdeI (YjbR/CyaY-like superfamily)